MKTLTTYINEAKGTKESTKSNDPVVKIGSKEYTLKKSDWENASDPICMKLVTDEEWRKVADELSRQNSEGAFDGYSDDDELDDAFWAAYEKAVLDNCTVFYYEDMTSDESHNIKSISVQKDKDDTLRKAYERIKSEKDKD